MLRRRLAPLLLLTTLLAIGCQSTAIPSVCTDAIGCVEIAPQGAIQIGVLQALSGDQQPFGLSGLRSIEMALNDRGGQLAGHAVDLQIEDSRCTKEGGATAAAKLVADPQLVGILGPSCSGAAETAIRVVSEAGLVLISGSSTAPSLTSVGGEAGRYWRPGFLRTAQNDAVSGQAAATFAFQVLGVRNAATIHDGDPYTQGLADMFRQAFLELGGQLGLSAAVNKGDTDMGPVLTAVANSGAELLFLPVFRPEGDLLVRQAREMDSLAQVVLMTGEGLYLATFLEAVGKAGAGLYMVLPAKPSGLAHDAFVARYRRKHGEEPATSYYAHNYDAASLLFKALEQVALRDPDGSLQIGRQALRDALYGVRGFDGLTGRLACDQHGDCGMARFQVVRVDDPAAGLAATGDRVVFTFPQEP